MGFDILTICSLSAHHVVQIVNTKVKNVRGAEMIGG